VTDRWFSLGIPVSSINKTDCHNITEILLKVALNTITLTLCSFSNIVEILLASVCPYQYLPFYLEMVFTDNNYLVADKTIVLSW